MIYPIELILYGWASFIQGRNLNPTREKAEKDTQYEIEPGSPPMLNVLPFKPPLLNVCSRCAL